MESGVPVIDPNFEHVAPSSEKQELQNLPPENRAWELVETSITQPYVIRRRINLFVIKGRRPLTRHINSAIISIKMHNYKDEQAYNASYKTTQYINIV